MRALFVLFLCISMTPFDSLAADMKWQHGPTLAELEYSRQVQAEKQAESASRQAAAFGENLGIAMDSAANRLGLDTAEFVRSPGGGIAMAVLAWKLGGQEAAAVLWRILVGATLLLVVVPVLLRWANRVLDQTHDIWYKTVPVLFGLFHMRVEVSRELRQDPVPEANLKKCEAAYSLATVAAIGGLLLITL